VGAIGFCMGGALSLAAAQLAGVDCVAPFYGIPAVSKAQAAGVPECDGRWRALL
jgi:carboxymethylenebutenolidase